MSTAATPVRSILGSDVKIGTRIGASRSPFVVDRFTRPLVRDGVTVGWLAENVYGRALAVYSADAYLVRVSA